MHISNKFESDLDSPKTKVKINEIVLCELPVGRVDELSMSCHAVICLFKGKMRFFIKDLCTCEMGGAEMIFMPSGERFSYEVVEGSAVILLRVVDTDLINRHLAVKNKQQTKMLYMDIREQAVQSMMERNLATLQVLQQLKVFFEGVAYYLHTGVNTKEWIELKISEFFELARLVYSNEQLCRFFYPVLSPDILFSEFVRTRWREFTSAKQMAAAMHLSSKQFSTRFNAVFGQNPQDWILQTKRTVVYREITTTDKPFKQIASENGFNGDTQFSRFCKKEFVDSPTNIRKNNSQK